MQLPFKQKRKKKRGHCEKVVTFWSMIQQMIRQVLEREIWLSACLALLRDWGRERCGVENNHLRYLLVHLIVVVARILLASKQKTKELPSKEEWLQKIQYMCLTDKISVWIKINEGRTDEGRIFQQR